VIVIASLIAVTAASWLFVLAGAGTGMSTLGMSGLDLALGGGMREAGSMKSGMSGGTMMGGPTMGSSMAGDGMSMSMAPAIWSATYAVIMFFMWWVMMIAMMLPAASPTILLFARIHGKQKARGQTYVPAGVFALGYLSAWAFFSVVAVAAQWALEGAGLLNMMMVTTVPWLGGALLLAAGVWQFTPWKQACLRHCRSPLSFLLTRWRQGWGGAFAMGVEHGAFCLGCCWFLMALLFFGGVMNLYWIGGLALFVLVEKLVPAGHWFGYAVGAMLSVWGAWMLDGAFAL
jgi:predicted metal-binding membrane protein